MESSIGIAALGFAMIALYFGVKNRLIRLERKLNQLLQHAGIDLVRELAISDRVKELARDPGRKIEAIKLYREETGAGLAEAKQAVETYINSL